MQGMWLSNPCSHIFVFDTMGFIYPFFCSISQGSGGKRKLHSSDGVG